MGKAVYYGGVMIKNSRWYNYFIKLSEDQQDILIHSVDKLYEDNQEYCDVGNYDHLCNLFTSLALYKLLMNQGKESRDAYKIVAQEGWKAVKKSAKTYQRLIRIPGMFKIFSKFLPSMFEKGSGYGWEHQWNEMNDHRMDFQCNKCIYATILEKYGIREFGNMFCHADIINYGHLPGVTFKREHTLCSDGKPCDFLFINDKKAAK